jgi:hypothetical protein
VIAVAPDHVRTGTHHLLAEGRVRIIKLPAGHAGQHHQAQFVGRRHEGRRLRIVGKAHVIEAVALDQEGVAIIRLLRQGVTHIRVFLVAVDAAQLERLAIEHQPSALEGQAAHADARSDTILHAVVGAFAAHGRFQFVEVRRLGRPQPRPAQREPDGHVPPFAGRQPHLLLRLRHLPALPAQRLAHGRQLRPRRGVGDLGLDLHDGRTLVRLGVGHEDAAAARRVRERFVRDVQRRLDQEPHAAVDAAVLDVVQLLERLGAGNRVVLVIGAHHEFVVALGVQGVGDVEGERQVAAQVLPQVPSVEPDVGHVHDGLEAQDGAFSRAQAGRQSLLVEHPALPGCAGDARFDPRRVGQVHAGPCAGGHLLGSADGAAVVAVEQPGRIQAAAGRVHRAERQGAQQQQWQQQWQQQRGGAAPRAGRWRIGRNHSGALGNMGGMPVYAGAADRGKQNTGLPPILV